MWAQLQQEVNKVTSAATTVPDDAFNFRTFKDRMGLGEQLAYRAMKELLASGIVQKLRIGQGTYYRMTNGKR